MGLLIGGSYLAGGSARQALLSPTAATQGELASLTQTPLRAAPPGSGAAAPPSASVLTMRDRFRQALNVTQSVAEPFHFRGEPARAAASHGADANCLAQAVYYEARGESTSGQAAVAQVVLNRVRHPAFPKTVCGVVFQRSAQGCQFSFACNGAMHGGIEPDAWRRAEQVAHRALSGAVMTDVGQATQFQAARIGGWANGLLKVAQIGEHVFFRFAGRQGSAGMFHDQAEPSVSHGQTRINVRVASLSPAAGPRPTEVPPAPSPAPSSAAIAESQAPAPAAAQPKAVGESTSTVKAPAAVVTVKTDESAASKPIAVAASGA